MDDVVIAAEGLTRAFGATLSVDRLSLEVRRGEVFGLLGHNGAGKTTTVRLLNGVLEPTSGAARVLGLAPARDGPALRRRTGVLTETPAVDERLTGRENLALFAELFGVERPRVKARVEEALSTFGLLPRADTRVLGWSKGMRQGLALARTILHSPELFFLDEPTSGLDPVATRGVADLIERLCRGEGKTVFLCTHNLDEAQRLCDRVGVMRRGKLVAAGTPAELGRRLSARVTVDVETDAASAEAMRAAIASQSGASAEAHLADGRATFAVHGLERAAVPGLVAAAVAAGVRLHRVAPREPTLEDVYFSLYGVVDAEPA